MSNIFLSVHPVMDLQKAWIIIRQQRSEEREFPLKTWKLQESLCLIWLIQPHKILNLFMCLFHRTDFLFQIFMVLLINYTFSQAKKTTTTNKKQKTHKETYTPHCLSRFHQQTGGQVRACCIQPQPVASDRGLGYPDSHRRWSLVSVFQVQQCFEIANCETTSLHLTEKLCDLSKLRRERKSMKITNLIGGRHASDLKCLRLQTTFFFFLTKCSTYSLQTN